MAFGVDLSIGSGLEELHHFQDYLSDFCEGPHTYLFFDLTQSINILLRFRTKIFPDEITYVFHL
jgi:hypothetical protein